ncbi:MAG: acetylglutamate kinase [Chloroflexota bacterium]
MDKFIVIKLGGSTLSSEDTIAQDIVSLQKQGKSLVVVHGGGSLITEWLARQGVPTRFVRGERVTDKPALEVVIAVLAGLVNKEIVATVNSLGGRAVGISGVDGALVQSKVRDAEMGYVGTVVKVDTTVLEALLRAGYVPIVSPIGFRADSAEAPQILNINGDTAAGEIAAAISAKKLIFLTDVAGVCDKSGKLLPRLSRGEAEALIADGVASGGMIPKLRACLRALDAGSVARIIDGRPPHALAQEVEGRGEGTTIYAKNRS